MATKPVKDRRKSPRLTGGGTQVLNWWNVGKGEQFLGKKPKGPQQLDPLRIERATTDGTAFTTQAQRQMLDPFAQQLADGQFRQIDRLARNLDNRNTRNAQRQVERSLQGTDRMDRIGGSAVATGANAGRQISNLAQTAQRQTDGSGRAIEAQAGQIVGIGDQYGGMLQRQGRQANMEADMAAGRMDPMARQALGIGTGYMNQIGGLGSMLARQAQRGFAASGPTEIEAELYRQGQQDLALGRSLSPEQMRDATQAARQGMAARGMATGSAGMAAELLNRDRYASQREAQRRSFAADANQLREQNVMARRQAAGNMATAGAGLLDSAGRLGLSSRELASNIYDASGRMRMAGTQLGGQLMAQAGDMRTGARDAAGRLLDAGGRLRLAGTTTAGDLRNMGAGVTLQGQQLGAGIIGQASGLRQQGAGMMADLDPTQRAIEQGAQIGRFAQQTGLSQIGQNAGRLQDLYGNAASFNVNMQGDALNNWMNNFTALRTGQQAAAATTRAANISAAATRDANNRPWWEVGLNTIGSIFSDKRMKADIKPVGKAGNVLGLTTYEYKYKGDDKKRVGFMAQDVKKVLPEAVEEVSVNGKKRLKIKPMVIGQALAEELAMSHAA